MIDKRNKEMATLIRHSLRVLSTDLWDIWDRAGKVEGNMRVTYTIELQVDVLSSYRSDEGIKAKKAFVDILKDHAQELYSQSTMISQHPVIVKLISMDDDDGIRQLDLFSKENPNG